jgi:hypothetical protein
LPLSSLSGPSSPYFYGGQWPEREREAAPARCHATPVLTPLAAVLLTFIREVYVNDYLEANPDYP